MTDSTKLQHADTQDKEVEIKRVKQPHDFKKAFDKYERWQTDTHKTGVHAPFVKVHQVNKMSRRHQHFCPIQQREVHLLSDGEFRAYKSLIWSPNVEAIEEQYPLDPKVTQSKAFALNYVHPREWETGEAKVMTTDFLVHHYPSTGLRSIAYSFKYWSQIYEVKDGETIKKQWRTWQKFRIEAKYWEDRNVDFQVVTERDFPKIVVRNIDFFKTATRCEVQRHLINNFIEVFINTWSKARYKILHMLLAEVSKVLRIEFIEADKLFRFCCYHKLIKLNLEQYIAHQTPVELSL